MVASSEATEPVKKLVLVDAYSLLFRAHFANPYLSAPDGSPTGALFGFSNMLLSLLNSQKPDSIVICWDGPERTHRKQEFEAYKAHRPEVDPQLKAQFPEARKLVQAFGIQSAELAGYEADDLIGTLAARGIEIGLNVVVLTGDSDQLQLAREGVAIEICQRGVSDVKVYGPDEVIERYGVPPLRLPDWKGLVGDTSDNIPGVPGIGEKTATALLQTWDSMENLLQHVPEVMPNKARLALEAHSEQAVLSKRLATIVCDAPVDLNIEPYAPTTENWQTVRALFEELQFKSLLTRLPRISTAQVSPPVSDAQPSLFGAGEEADADVVLIVSSTQFEAALTEIQKIGSMSALLATTSESPLHADIMGVAFAASSTKGWYVPVRVAATHSAMGGLFDEDESSGSLPYALGIPELRSLFTAQGIEIFSHNAKPLIQRVEFAGVAAPSIAFDTLLAAYLLESGRATYLVDELAATYLRITTGSEASNSDPVEDRLARQAALVFRLVEPMRAQLEKLGMMDVMQRIEMPLEPVLAEVERAGLLIDGPYLSTLSIRLNREMEGLASDIYNIAGEEFNIGSPKQLQTILFDKMQLPTGKKTKTGYSTGGDLLEQLAVEYPIAQKIIDYREIAKLKSTYADALVKLANPGTGRVHTTLNQTVASTGRLSSSEPNLQNIPIRSELGREIRRAFIAPKGRVLLSCDYSQIELRVLAHMSGDPALSDAFVSGADVHAATAARVFDVPLEQVSTDQRRQAKTINFAVIYGQSAFALAGTLGVDTKTAGEWIKEYFNALPGVQRFITETTATAHTNRYVSTLLGRRRYLPELDSPNHNMRQFAERAAVNMPIQGTAADIMKLAMIDVYNEVQRNWSVPCTMLLQVHDELLFEVDPAAVADITPVIQKIMGGVYPLNVPLVADAKYGPNWAEMQNI